MVYLPRGESTPGTVLLQAAHAVSGYLHLKAGAVSKPGGFNETGPTAGERVGRVGGEFERE